MAVLTMTRRLPATTYYGYTYNDQATTGYFWRNENAARESRLARLAQGANIAALRAQAPRRSTLIL